MKVAVLEAAELEQYVAAEVRATVELPYGKGLERQFYKKHNTCDDLEEFIKHQVKLFWTKDRSITPKLLGLVYSDCFVTAIWKDKCHSSKERTHQSRWRSGVQEHSREGVDSAVQRVTRGVPQVVMASVLLDNPNSEKKAPQNIGLGGFAFVDKLKIVVEARCPEVVSCSDILHLAAREAVHLAGAPSYSVLTGRRDGRGSSAASVDLPLPSISFESALSYFQSKGLNLVDITTLLAKMRKKCPRKGQGDPPTFLNPDSGKNEESISLTQEFANGFEDFRKSWAYSMSRMGSIGVLTGTQGEIRHHCRYPN
ncbi:hypothetical protein IFM89_014446 [Coptis chinensis]|uniref:Plant heme peroxidase family profile domain-containing protein n=1 Tax=Coptis chinensis TaxID=261450 RepID=A0A835I441_9MAGN|nr:hypothetical protein IFM89_014446 [Coptis chinensis]